MSGESALASVGGLSQGDRMQSNELEQSIRNTLDDAFRSDRMATAAESLATAFQMKGSDTNVDRHVTELAEPNRGKIVNEMDQLVGGEFSDADAAKKSEDLVNEVMERAKTLYFDMTNFTVAWKIVQTSRQDISRLLTAN
jgi:hypothetical protein